MPEFDTGLDRSATLSQDEADRLAKWYAEQHGLGDLDLVGFVTLLMEQRQDVLKGHRFVAAAKVRAQKIGVLANILLFLHHYTVIGNAPGILYEVIGARKAGATKAEVVDTIMLGYVNGGAANGLNAVADRSREYLSEWPADSPRQVASPWPPTWHADRAAAARLFDGEPAYARLLKVHRPEVLAEWRALQRSVVTTLPPQFAALCLVHLAVIRGHEAAIRFAATQAKAAGVTRDELIDTIAWAMSYSGEVGLRATGDVLVELVEGWS